MLGKALITGLYLMFFSLYFMGYFYVFFWLSLMALEVPLWMTLPEVPGVEGVKRSWSDDKLLFALQRITVDTPCSYSGK